MLSTNDNIARQIPGFKASLMFPMWGIFGHSLGGAAAASAMLADNRFSCGLDMNGSSNGAAVDAGLDRPLLLMSAPEITEAQILV